MKTQFDRLFDRLLYKLKRRDPVLTTVVAGAQLRVVEADGSIDAMRTWNPWFLVLIMRWALEHGGTKREAVPNLDDLAEMVNLVKELDADSPFLDEGPERSINRFMRTVAYQQFYLQRGLGRDEVARQYSAYARLPPHHRVQVAFAKEFGISIGDFLDCAFLLWAWARVAPTRIVVKNQPFANTDIAPETVAAFLDSISRTPEDMSAWLQTRPGRVQTPFFQVNEPSPLVRYPLLKVEDGYVVLSLGLLRALVKEAVFRVCSGEDTRPAFGRAFEAYIGVSAEAGCSDTIAESALQTALGNGNATDYLLPFSSANIFVECKGVELRPIACVNPTERIMQQEAKDNVAKAVVQGLRTATALRDQEHSLPADSNLPAFLLVVTPEPLWLGPGEGVWAEFLEGAVAKALKKKPDGIDLAVLPPERIFFISAEEFDALAALAQAGGSIPDALFQAVDDNREHISRKFTLGMHLRPMLGDAPAELDHLREPFDEAMERIQRTFARERAT